MSPLTKRNSSSALLLIAIAVLLSFHHPSCVVLSCETPHHQHLPHQEEHHHQDEKDAKVVTMQSIVHEEEKVDASTKCVDPTFVTTEKTEEDVESVKKLAVTDATSAEEVSQTDDGISNKVEKTIKEQHNDVDSLLQKANDLFQDDKLLASARILRSLDKEVLTSHHHEILRQAEDCESLMEQLMKPPITTTSSSTSSSSSSNKGEEWTKLGERHDGKHNSIIYYKQPSSTTFMTRIETPIPPTLLVPLLSVLNETDLYSTWLPYWNYPFRLGVSSSTKLQQKSRVSQIIQVKVDVPFPFAKREVIIDAVSVDDIEETGRIAIRMTTPKTSSDDETTVVPYPEQGVIRQEFEGGFLFCKCPEDHPSLIQAGKGEGEGEKDDAGDDDDDDKILVYFTITLEDKKLHLFPQALINFVSRIVIGHMWDMFLRVAEEVKDGERPQHSAAIEEKRGVLYDWVEERIHAMFERLKESKE